MQGRRKQQKTNHEEYAKDEQQSAQVISVEKAGDNQEKPAASTMRTSSTSHVPAGSRAMPSAGQLRRLQEVVDRQPHWQQEHDVTDSPPQQQQ